MAKRELTPREKLIKEKQKDFKKGIEKRLLLSAFNTPQKREYNKTHKNQIP